MPVHQVPGGWQWGSHGKVYPTKAQAVDQEQAAIANGFQENKGSSGKPVDNKAAHKKKQSAAQKAALLNMLKKHGS